MKTEQSLLYLLSIFSLTFAWSPYHAAQVGPFNAPSSPEKRYYHHDVHLDDNKHNDEFFSFVTRPDLDAPRWNIEVFNENAVTPGYWFSAPYSNVAQSTADAPWNAPHIYDSNGDLVWSGAPVFDGFTTFDFRVTNIQGKPMLSLIYPRGGKAIIFDESYTIHKILDLGDEALRENEVALNSHEFTTAANGTKALYLNRLPKRTSRKNSASVGFDEECFAIFDGIMELDTVTWETIHTWNSEGHIGLDESYVTSEPIRKRCTGNGAWDFFHANSIDTFPDGDYLVSGRRTNAIYKISHTTGSIIWRLGGKKSDFQMPLQFSGQHSAMLYEQNDTHVLIALLDNAFLPPGTPQTTNHESRGLLLALDTTAMIANLVSEFSHPEGKYTQSRGNMQMLPNTHAWICWSDGSLQSEHVFDGTLIMKARFKAQISSYRTFKSPWIGNPHYPPDVHSAVIDKNGDWYTIVHMSWNGATEVREWKIYHTNSEGTERDLVVKIPKRGFETAAWTEGYGQYVIAEAIDKDGVTLGVSNVFASLAPRNYSQVAFATNTQLENQSRFHASINNSPAILIFGILLGIMIGAAASAILTPRCTARRKGSAGGTKQSKGVYEPLILEDEADDVELQGFEDDLEEEISESKKLSV